MRLLEELCPRPNHVGQKYLLEPEVLKEAAVGTSHIEGFPHYALEVFGLL